MGDSAGDQPADSETVENIQTALLHLLQAVQAIDQVVITLTKLLHELRQP